MATSHLPDSNIESPTAAQMNANAPLMSVLRQDNSAPGPTIQFESAAGLLDDLEDSDDEAPRSGEKRSGRRKIKIEYIEDKSRRHITFSKRKAGIMKKAYELSTLTGTQVLLLVASETGHVYTFATPKLQPLITKQEGKNLIQACLNSPDHHSAIPEYLPTVQSSANSVLSHYENDVVEEDLTPRSGSTVVAGSSSATHGYLPTGTTPTPPAGSSAASVAAAAAQVFMNSGQPSHYVGYAPQASSGNYWNGGNPPATGMYTPIPAKSGQQSQQQHLQQLQQSQQSQQSQQQQQQQQQQQMYHALMQQQQLFQHYQQHQNQSNHHNGHDNADS